MNRERIVLGMSGGVDSAVSAVLLMRAGYEVFGVTCLFIEDERSHAAVRDAEAVCSQLGISHVVKEGAKRFESEVISPFVDDYANGLTPSPCVSCNACCKISLLIEAAGELGASKISTGHYARIAQLSDSGRFVVKTARDISKDQSYMLSQLSQNQLSRLVLPLGTTTKTEVRLMAEDSGLSVAQKPESQDICFIEGSHLDFLNERGVSRASGNIVDARGAILGTHEGLFAYTLGQRKGIGIASSKPYYVIDKNFETNELIIGYKDETFITALVVESPNWQAFEKLEGELECTIKLRYRSRAVPCVIKNGDRLDDADGKKQEGSDVEGRDVVVRLLSPQPTTAPGQHAVFYHGETVLGGGVIKEIGR